MKLIAIDFETANSFPESACAIGVSVFEDGIQIDDYYTLIKPLSRYGRFDYRNVRIHQILPEHVYDAQGFEEVYDYLSQYFEDSLFVAHNAGFDMTVFERCCKANHLTVPEISYFDTVKLTREFFPYMDHHKLNDCCSYIGIDLDHHNAASDAQACAIIVLNCMILADEIDLMKFIEKCQVPIKKLIK